jgi:hypothetical protein
MVETASFTKRFVGAQPETEVERGWRNGFIGDNSGGLSPFCLSLRAKEGRLMEGPPWSLFTWHAWMDDGGTVEKLLLLFTVGGVYVEGFHMKRQVEAFLEEGKLKRIQEHDKTEIEAIRAHNLDKRKPEEKEPIVLRILTVPNVIKRLEIEEYLGPIIVAMKGEKDSETGESGNIE